MYFNTYCYATLILFLHTYCSEASTLKTYCYLTLKLYASAAGVCIAQHTSAYVSIRQPRDSSAVFYFCYFFSSKLYASDAAYVSIVIRFFQSCMPRIFFFQSCVPRTQVSAKLGRGIEETFLQITKKMIEVRETTGGRSAGTCLIHQL